MTTNHPEKRQASRLIVIDQEGRILLFRHAFKTGKTFWAPPGGGLEPGETFEQAALREAHEELGTQQLTIEYLWENTTDFVYIDQPVQQQERFFRATCDLANLLSNVEETHRLEGIVEVKWWTLADLELTEDVVFPAGLAGRMRKLANA
jgi:8-oxo-dGTP pyrophosphatase MutT (NUDIX family)